jgi:uncharacterized membrane protein
MIAEPQRLEVATLARDRRIPWQDPLGAVSSVAGDPMNAQPSPRAQIHVPTQRGERAADAVATSMGSWRFIIIQSIVVAVWIAVNVVAIIQRFDPYPFILLNLLFSTQAAYAAPIIMMSQNRQAQKDRQRDDHEAVTVDDTAATVALAFANTTEIQQIARELSAMLAAQDRVLAAQDRVLAQQTELLALLREHLFPPETGPHA